MDPISTALVAAAVKEVSSPLTKMLKSMGVDTYNSIVSKYQECFQGHVDHTYNRCSKMKNILYRDESVDFMPHYVNVEFSMPDDEICSDRAALVDIIKGRRVLLCGTAGAGKTMFMRWCAINLIKNLKEHGRIPLFLELRYFENEYVSSPLEKYIYDKTSAVSDASTYEQFIIGMTDGLFIILLDAVDEVSPSIRDSVIRKIMNLLRDYPKIGIAISSRYDEKLESIQDLSILRTRAMRMDQVVNFIQKLQYDDEIKSKLIQKIESGIYDELKGFISNPLLATILLITFERSADIPSKITHFYQQAFEALYQRHDATKGVYRRFHHAGLSIDRFQNIFAAFCFNTYLNFKFEFSDSELISAFREACEYCQEGVDPLNAIKDSMESVCLIQKEGLDNVFSHRSFQEFFCAYFICQYREENIKDIMDTISKMELRSNVLRMVNELSRDTFDYEWLNPRLSEFIKSFKGVDFSKKEGLLKSFKELYSDFSVAHHGHINGYSITGSTSNRRKTFFSQIAFAAFFATHGEFNPTEKLLETNLWDDYNIFVEYLISRIPGEDERTLKKFKDQDPVDIDLNEEDVDWLVYTRLPEILSRYRDYIIEYQSKIIARRDSRSKNIRALLSKPRHRSGRGA